MTTLKIPAKNLYNCIVKLVNIYESSLEELTLGEDFACPKTQKQINNTLNYLVKLIMQLNKLNNNSINHEDKDEISKQDEEIINRFLAKYKDKDFKSV